MAAAPTVAPALTSVNPLPPSAPVAGVEVPGIQGAAYAPTAASAAAPPLASGPPGPQIKVSSKQKALNSILDKANPLLAKHGGKNGVWLGEQLKGQASGLQSVVVVGDINSGGPPISFHVFKGGNTFSKDDIVKDDAGNPHFYLSFPHNFGSSWTLTLHRGGSKDGPLLATLTKGAYGLTKDDITILLPTGYQTILHKPSLLSSAHDFTGVGGVKFKWKSDGPLSHGITCLDMSTGHVVATWEKSYATFHKDGELKVNPTYSSEMDLIVATGLAMEEWRREEEEKSGKAGPTSTKNLVGMGMKFLGKKK